MFHLDIRASVRLPYKVSVFKHLCWKNRCTDQSGHNSNDFPKICNDTQISDKSRKNRGHRKFSKEKNHFNHNQLFCIPTKKNSLR